MSITKVPPEMTTPAYLAATGDLSAGLVTADTGDTANALGELYDNQINVMFHGADNTGNLDSTAAFQAVALLAGSVGGRVRSVLIPPGVYKITDTISWENQHTFIYGSGPNNTVIDFNPSTSNKVCFSFTAPSNPPYYIQVFCGMRDIKFRGTVGNTQSGKVAIDIVTNEEFWMENFRIENFSTTVSGSAIPGAQDCVGLRHAGWQLNRFCNGHIYADRPIELKLNPWTLPVFLDLDDTYFEHLILAPIARTGPTVDEANACIRVEDGSFITNVCFRNTHFVGGKNGIEWIDTERTITGIVNNGGGFCRVTTSAAHNFLASRYVEITGVVGTHEANVRAVATYVSATEFDLLTVAFTHAYTSGGKATRSPGNSYMLSFDNCRWESRHVATDWSVYFDRKGSPLDQIEFRNCYFDASSAGVYLRRVRAVTFVNCTWPNSSAVSLDYAGALQSQISLQDCAFSSGGAKAKLSGMKPMWAANKFASAQNMEGNGLWVYDTQDSSSLLTLDGSIHRSFRFRLADDEIVDLQTGSGSSESMYIMTVFATDGASIFEGMTIGGDTGFSPVKISGTANTAITDLDTDLCIYQSSSNTKLKNRLGATVTCLVTIEARSSIDVACTNLTTNEVYTTGTPLNLTDMVITDAGPSPYVIANVRTTSAQGGTLNTATAGATTSTYYQGISTGQGDWRAEGTVTDVNTLLAGLTFTPHATVAITNCADNGSGKVRLTIPGHGYTSTQTLTTTGITGTTEANVAKGSFSYVDVNTMDLSAVTFVTPYISGGTASYQGTLHLNCQVTNQKAQLVSGRRQVTSA